jgi:hypothetical protein
MAKLFNRAKMTTATTGSGTVTLGSASNGFQTFAAAGVSNGDVVQYVIEEGANFEIGTGSYSSSGTSLTRSPTESSNSNNAITLAGQATVSITAVADDLNRLQHGGSDRVTVSSTGASVTGNLAVSGTVDGRDVASDGSKLDGIESSATADQTASEIRALVESASDSNVFTDADHSKLNAIEAGATGDQTNAEIRAAVEAATDSNVFTDADHSKLNGIEANAKNDQTITAGGGLTGGGTGDVTISHSDTSSVSSTDNSGNTFVQDLTFDTYGHVTAVGTGSVSVGNGTLTVQGTGALGGSGTFTANQSGNTTISISHDDTSSQGSVNGSGRTYIQDITLDTYGHVTGLATATETVVNTDTNTNQLTTFQVEDGDGTEVTISHGKEWKFVEAGGININWTDTSTGSDGDPFDLSFNVSTSITAGGGLTGGGALSSNRTISHADTSSQSSVNNSGRTYIQDITLDTYGHITGITSATETVVNTDTNTTYSAGSGLGLSGTTFSHSDTSSQGSVNNSDDTVIQDITLDTYGHVTGIGSKNLDDIFLRKSATSGLDMNNNNITDVEDIYLQDRIYHDGDTNTYMQFHSGDQWRVVVGGSERLEVKNSSPHVLVSGDLNSTSDERLKKNIKPIDNALADICQLEGVTFDWKDTGTQGQGFIAQQVEPIIPDVVNTDEDTGMKSINYVGLIGHLVEAIKSQQTQIDDLKAEIQSIKS